MNELLKEYDRSKVDVFLSYVHNLKTEKDKDGKLKNYWATITKDEEFSNIFKKVYETGLFIDGDTVTLTNRGRIIITYDYHAYINKILLSYPESTFDFQVVYEGDDISFRKESGKIYYTHKKNNPFNTNKKVIGAYGVIKNSKGEFIETINIDDITKMKNSSKMKYIWDTWFDRMVLKSVIKRICSIHFKDITKSMDYIDNETNDPDRATIDELILADIDNAETEEVLGKIYNHNIATVKDKKQFIEVLGKRKVELQKELAK